MNAWIDSALVFLVLTNLMLLGSSRLAACVRLSAFQGLILGLLTVLVQADEITARGVFLAIGSTAVKAGVFPWLLSRALREADVRREVEPYVGYTLSLVLGTLLLGLSAWFGSRLPLPPHHGGTLVVPVAFFSILAGLLLIVTRRKALTQVLGYLVLENGIYAFGIALAHEEPLLVELGVLLDVFVAVFVMGITIFHISREFDHIDVDRLSSLKDTD
jgi:hydrogenase-4 component E